MFRTCSGLLSVALFAICANSASAAIATDVTISKDQSSATTTVATAGFSTAAGNELLLAFIATDNVTSTNTTVRSVTGGGLTWTLVRRTNVQRGTAEIWRAFASSVLSNATVTATLSQAVYSSLTVMSFTGVDVSGTNGSGAIGATGTGNANPGLPSATLVTTRGGSLVLGVGNDFDRAIARAPGAGQIVVHSYLAPIGDTYWVQRQSSVTPLSGTSVSINDTAPSGDRYNVSIVEVLAAAGGGASTYGVSGTMTSAANGAVSQVTLSQNATAIATTTVDSSGNYAFTNVANGTYVVTPLKTGFAFAPASQTIVVNGANAQVPAFTATRTSWSVTGAISPAPNGTGSTVTLTQNGARFAAATADSAGNYSFASVPNGSYVVAPARTGFVFNPASQTIVVNGAVVTVPTFTATKVAWSISGTITPATSGSGAQVTLSGPVNSTAVADSSGNFVFAGLANGRYTVTPNKSGFTFSPTEQAITIADADAAGVNFASQRTSPPLLYPDLRDIIPTGSISIVMSAGHRMFQYTHDTLNGGPGPLIIQPAYNPASGAYQGTQYIYNLNGNTWSIGLRIPIAGAFIFHAEHGHFHFPFATYGLYAVGADGGPGAPLITSGKIGFCIADSFIYDPTLPNAGALGNLGSCSDPTSIRGLDIGAVDEYDRTDDGQSIQIDTLPDGTYWLRALVDPNNFFADANKSNNETDVKLTITGTTVQVLNTVVPTLANPPAITLTSPSGTVAGVVALAATTAGSSVQMLVDGSPLGAPISSAPYTLDWDTTAVADGTHWLAAQTTGPTGVIGTSAVVAVTVANGGTTPPSIQITGPSDGSTLSSVVTLYAQAASGRGIANVTFFVDGTRIGGPVTAPPFMIAWDTTTSAEGAHVLTATAVDTAGMTATSAPINVSVDNTHPPAVIGKETTVSVDGAGTMITSPFSTATAGDLLVAFVSYDGPQGSAQTATVSGAGLTWTMMMRSNTQWGTSEIWTARPAGTLVNATVQALPGFTGYHGSMTVIAFTNAAAVGVVGRSGAPTGAPDIGLPGIMAGNWVFAVGNDWDNAAARTPVAGQVLVHQRVDTSTGDTYWVQSTTTPATANALVDIHDTAPTGDRWNYAAVEIVAKRQ